MGAWYVTAYGENGGNGGAVCDRLWGEWGEQSEIAYGEDGEFFTRSKLLKLPNFPTIPISDLGRAPQCRLSIKSNIADPIIVNCQLSIINYQLSIGFFFWGGVKLLPGFRGGG